MSSSTALRIAAAAGFLAVALGAFGAHGLKPTLIATGQLGNWETGAHYHMAHAIVLLVLALRESVAKLPILLFSAGIVIFSGSLYLLAALNIPKLGAITPIGGLCLLAGWLTLAIRGKA